VKTKLSHQGVLPRVLCSLFNKPLLAARAFEKAQILCCQCMCNNNCEKCGMWTIDKMVKNIWSLFSSSYLS